MMKKAIVILSMLSLVACAPGCAVPRGVPATRVGFNPSTGEVEVKSPKDIKIGNLKITRTTNSLTVELTNYSSINSPDVIAAQAQQNIAVAGQNAATTGKLLDLLAPAVQALAPVAGAAAKAAVAP